MTDPNDDNFTIALKLVMDVSDLRSLVDNRRFRRRGRGGGAAPAPLPG